MIQAYVFDTDGTLFDVNSAMRKHTNHIGDSAERLYNVYSRRLEQPKAI